MKNLKAATIVEMMRRSHPDVTEIKIISAGVECLKTLNPLTHLYLVWEGFPYEVMCAIGALVKKSTIRKIVVVEKSMRATNPVENMAQMGFGRVTLHSEFPVYMVSSGMRLMAYCFERGDADVDEHRHRVDEHPDLDEVDAYVPPLAAAGGSATTRSMTRRLTAEA